MANTTARPRNDAYTGLLAISFLALVGATALMALDADELGKPPEKGALKIDVPGTLNPGATKSEGLRRPDTDKMEPGPAKGPDPKTSRAEPGLFPDIPAVEVPAVVPAAAVVPVPKPAAADDIPPVDVKPFLPPM